MKERGGSHPVKTDMYTVRIKCAKLTLKYHIHPLQLRRRVLVALQEQGLY